MTDARLFDQCLAVYDAMNSAAVPHLIENGPPDLEGRSGIVYTGFTTYLIESLGLTISNYTPVMRRLQLMHCIFQLQRGGRGTPSQWLILKRPTERDFTHARQWRIQERVRFDALERRVAQLEDQVRDVS
jgi:hypothetical protein